MFSRAVLFPCIVCVRRNGCESLRYIMCYSPCVNLNFADEEGGDMKDEESDGGRGDEADDEGEVAE